MVVVYALLALVLAAAAVLGVLASRESLRKR